MERTKMKVVYTITSREGRAGDSGRCSVKKYWSRVGIAFENSDGSLDVKLEALPVSGELHIRDYVPRQETRVDRPQPRPLIHPSTRAAA